MGIGEHLGEVRLAVGSRMQVAELYVACSDDKLEDKEQAVVTDL